MEPENFIPFLTVTSIVEGGVEHSTIDNHGHKSYLDMLFTVEQKRTPIALAQDRQREREDYERAVRLFIPQEEPIKERRKGGKPKLSPEKQEERMQLYDQGLNDCQMAQILDITQSAVYCWRQRNGLKENGYNRHFHDWDKILPLAEEKLKQGQSKHSIARELGIPRSTLTKKMKG